MKLRFKIQISLSFLFLVLTPACEKKQSANATIENHSANSKASPRPANMDHLLKLPAGMTEQERAEAVKSGIFAIPLDRAQSQDRDTLWDCLQVREAHVIIEQDQGLKAWKILKKYEKASPKEQALFGLLAMKTKRLMTSLGGDEQIEAVLSEAWSLLYLAAGVLPEEASQLQVLEHCWALVLSNSEGLLPHMPEGRSPASVSIDKSEIDAAISEFNEHHVEIDEIQNNLTRPEVDSLTKADRQKLWRDLEYSDPLDIAFSSNQYQEAETALLKYASSSPVQQIMFGRLVYFRLNLSGYGVTFSQALAERNPLHAQTNAMAIESMRKGLGPDAKNLSVPDLIKKADETLRKAAAK